METLVFLFNDGVWEDFFAGPNFRGDVFNLDVNPHPPKMPFRQLAIGTLVKYFHSPRLESSSLLHVRLLSLKMSK